jgi:hypothetical protein
MNRKLKTSSFRSPWGFNTNSRGWSETEPVVTEHPTNPNPVGVEQLFDGKTGIVYSTPTGSIKTIAFPNHGFRFTSPAAILIMTPPGLGGVHG